MSFELPIEKLPARTENPEVLILYSKPKSGKTELLALLDKCLILDFQDGTKSIDAMALRVIGLESPPNESEESIKLRHEFKDEKGIIRPKVYLDEVGKKLKNHNPYSFLALDTLTDYEAMCIPTATRRYMKSVLGKYFNRYTEEDFRLSGGKNLPGVLKPVSEWSTVLELPKGGGYKYLWDEYMLHLNRLRSLGIPLILTAHIRLSQMTNKADVEVEVKDINLTGKLKDLTMGEFDTIGYLYREGNKNFVSFTSSDEVASGSRSKHLTGQTILLGESDGNPRNLKAYWDKIYI